MLLHQPRFQDCKSRAMERELKFGKIRGNRKPFHDASYPFISHQYIEFSLPGKSSMEPRIFKFGTPYSEMYKSMATTPEDQAFFSRNGVLQLCRRGAAVKVSFSLFPLFPTFCNLPIINIKIQVGTSTMARYAI